MVKSKQAKITTFFNQSQSKQNNSNKTISKQSNPTHIFSTTYNELLSIEGSGIFKCKWMQRDIHEVSCISGKSVFSDITDKRTTYNEGVLLSSNDLDDPKAFKSQRMQQYL